MKRLAIAVLALALAASAEAHWKFPWNRTATPPTDPLHQVIAHVTDAQPSDPMQAAISPIDHVIQTVLGPKFADEANKSLAMAGTSDQMFSQCVNFGLTLRAELIAQPLVTAPVFATSTVDQSCSLCVIEALRQDREMVDSGRLAGKVADVRQRVRSIQKRTALACGPLAMDEANVAGQAFDFLSGLLGH